MYIRTATDALRLTIEIETPLRLMEMVATMCKRQKYFSFPLTSAS